MDLLQNLAQQSDRTLVVSLHDVDFARSHCDRMIGLRQGQVLFDAAPHQVSPDLIADLYRLESH